MALPVFPSLIHKVPEVIYPNSSVQVQFGGGYTFAAPPSAPDQRIFRLYFTGMRWYLSDADDGTIDYETRADADNVGVLDQFYQSVRQWGNFTYNHSIYGALTVKFKNPLSLPTFDKDLWVLQDFQVDLLEIII